MVTTQNDINHGILSYLYIKNNDNRLCSDFLRSVACDAGFPLLIWGGFESNPLCNAMDKMKHVKYGSRLYSVSGDKPADNIAAGSVIGMEAALL